MKRPAILILFCLAATAAMAQRNKQQGSSHIDTVLHKPVYLSSETWPEPVGGIEKLYDAIMRQIRIPEKLNGQIISKVIVGFVVEANGKVDGERVIKVGDGEQHIIADQMVAIIKKYKWVPGTLNGKPVPVYFQLPIRINLQGD